MAINQWAIDWLSINIDTLEKKQFLRNAYPRSGLGAFFFSFANAREAPKISYISLTGLDDLALDADRRFAIEQSLKTYDPKTEAVAVTISPIADGRFEVTTVILKLT